MGIFEDDDLQLPYLSKSDVNVLEIWTGTNIHKDSYY